MGIVIVDKSNLGDFIDLSLLLFPEITADEMRGFYASFLDSEKEIGLLYQQDNKYVGYTHLSVRSDYVNGTDSSPVAFIEAIYVLPEYRKQGIARKFVEYAEWFARQRGCRQLASDCLIDNEMSADFHKSCGFIEKERVICLVKDV